MFVEQFVANLPMLPSLPISRSSLVTMSRGQKLCRFNPANTSFCSKVEDLFSLRSIDIYIWTTLLTSTWIGNIHHWHSVTSCVHCVSGAVTGRNSSVMKMKNHSALGDNKYFELRMYNRTQFLRFHKCFGSFMKVVNCYYKLILHFRRSKNVYANSLN